MRRYPTFLALLILVPGAILLYEQWRVKPARNDISVEELDRDHNSSPTVTVEPRLEQQDDPVDPDSSQSLPLQTLPQETQPSALREPEAAETSITRSEPKTPSIRSSLDESLSSGALRESPEKYDSIFPSSSDTPKGTTDFGILPSVSNGRETHLKNAICSRIPLADISIKTKLKSTFFNSMSGAVLEGDLKLTDARKFKMSIRFAGGKQRISKAETILITDSSNAVVEHRDSSHAGQHSAWRLNLCSKGIVYLQDRCPWNSEFHQELKDFHWDPEANLLVGLVYCRKSQDLDWTFLGTFELGPISE